MNPGSTIGTNNRVTDRSLQRTMDGAAVTSVRFSEATLCIEVARSDPEENRKKWHCDDDITNFKREMAKDVAASSRVFEMKGPLGLLSDDDFIECLGLESLLRQGMIDRVDQMKKMHLKRIFIEQSRQRHSSTNNEEHLAPDNVERLALLSSISSAWTRRRAHVIAVRQGGMN